MNPAPIERNEHNRQTLPALTGLRFFAALAVVFTHFTDATVFPRLLRPFTVLGGVGVSQFFVLSGFILTYNYYDRFAAGAGGYRSYLQARFARIYPIYLLSFVLVGSVMFGRRHSPELMPQHGALIIGLGWFVNLFSLQAWTSTFVRPFLLWNPPSWSVSVEWFFYLFFPFFVSLALARLRTTRQILVAALVLYLAQWVAFALAMALLAHFFPGARLFIGGTNDVLYLFPPLRAFEFCLGAMMALLMRQTRGRRPWLLAGSRRGAVTRDCLLVGMALCLVLVQRLPGPAGHTGMVLNQIRLYLVWTPFEALTVLLLAVGSGGVAWLLSRRVVVLLGEASYSLYMIHWLPFMLLWERAIAGQRVSFAVAVAVMTATIGASVVLYVAVEAPARRLLRPRPAERGGAETAGSERAGPAPALAAPASAPAPE